MGIGLGEIIEIPGLGGKWAKVDAVYKYGDDKCKCPICAGLRNTMGWLVFV